jgi:ATP diphosphatase
MRAGREIGDLLAIMAALRAPGTGCPWDLEQTFETIVPYTIEEAYEVADAVERADIPDLVEELGDLLLQVVFHAQMGREAGTFDFGDVVQAITSKLIRRHPHVFGSARDLAPEDVKKLWGEIKAAEKTERRAARAAAGLPEDPETKGVLAGVPTALPGLTRAVKLQSKASSVGFDWNDARLVLDKIREEAAEVEAAIDEGDKKALAGEVGDLLFAMANLARHLDVDPEEAVRGANAKFARRFAHIETRLAAAGTSPDKSTLAEMDGLWNEAKALERG